MYTNSVFNLFSSLFTMDFFSVVQKLLTYVSSTFVAKSYANAKDLIHSTFEDTSSGVKKLIEDNGYGVEQHDVTTGDGYILSLFRIYKRHPKNNDCSVVLLEHGLLACCADWIANTDQDSLGFMLADCGWDVWLGNVRGNTYGRRHIRLSSNSKEFCNFSFDEMATYDLPAMIDYILKLTKKDDLTYIAHSQGSTIAFAMLSEMPEYNKKINHFIAYGPVTTVGYAPSIIRHLAPVAGSVKFLLELLGIYELLSNDSYIVRLSKLACKTPLKNAFKIIFDLVGGIDKEQFNIDRAEIYAQNDPAGTSTKNLVHWAQLIMSMKFQKYDYGKVENMKRYGQGTPPEYDLSRITAPVTLFWGLNDWLSNPVDVRLLEERMKERQITSHCIELAQFAHFDFIFGRNVRELVYEKTVEIIS